MPAIAPRSPEARISQESDTATRLVKTLMIETCSKLVAIIGAVAIWTAREIAKRFESSLGGLLKGCKTVRFTDACEGLLRSRMPKTAAMES